MPYLQFDLPGRYSAVTKRELALRLGSLHAEIMQTTPGILNVGFRELGENNLWRCSEEVCHEYPARRAPRDRLQPDWAGRGGAVP